MSVLSRCLGLSTSQDWMVSVIVMEWVCESCLVRHIYVWCHLGGGGSHRWIDCRLLRMTLGLYWSQRRVGCGCG